jgi:hypothetical protein
MPPGWRGLIRHRAASSAYRLMRPVERVAVQGDQERSSNPGPDCQDRLLRSYASPLRSAEGVHWAG